LSNRIFKNYQVNVGIPVQIRQPVNFHTVQHAYNFSEVKEEEPEQIENEENYADIISKAREEADLLIKEAQLEALRLLDTAEREAVENRLRVEEEARNKGYEEGINEAKRQYEDLLQEAEFIREHARVEYKEVLENIESDAVNVIMCIVRKVIGSEISVNKENILYLVREAFDKCANKENTVLKVSPEDYEYLEGNRERLLSMIEGIGDLEIKKDSSLKAGACIVETPFGSLDAGVQTKLEKIEEAFRSVIGS